MKRAFILCVLSLAFGASLSANPDLLGLTEKELFARKGFPIGKTVFRDKAIYRYADMDVGLIAGKITSVTPRNRQREAELREHSAQRNAEESAKRDAIRMKNMADAAAAEMQYEAYRLNSGITQGPSPFTNRDNYVKEMAKREQAAEKSRSTGQSFREKPEVVERRKQTNQQNAQRTKESQARNAEVHSLNRQIDRTNNEIQRLQKTIPHSVIQTESAQQYQAKQRIKQAIQDRESEVRELKEKRDKVMFGK